MTDLLLSGTPMGFSRGIVSKVLFQTGWSGIPVDDLEVQTRDPEGILYLQIKRDLEFSIGNPKFLRVISDCWKVFSRAEFDSKKEYYGVGLEVYQRDLDMDLDPVLRLAGNSETSEQFFDKLNAPGAFSKDKKNFVELFREAITKETGAAIHDDLLWKFMKNLRVLYFDLKPEGVLRRSTVNLLRQVVVSGAVHEAAALLAILKDMASRTAASAGFYTLEKLKEEIPKGIMKSDYKSIFDRDQYDERLRDYLKTVIDHRNAQHDLDGKPLSQYYVDSDAVVDQAYRWEEATAAPNLPHWKLCDFLAGGDWLVLIGAAFGIGKTSMMRMIASRQAKKYRDDDEGYIPILVFLKERFDHVYNQENLSFVLSNIVAPSEIARHTKILLILDGLDEFGEAALELVHFVKELHEMYPLMKIIITSRMKPGVQDLIGVARFVRLLPFKENQVNSFFKKYDVALTYNDLDSYGLKEEEKRKPLFCWMMAIIASNMTSLSKATADWTPEMRKSLIYQEFIHSLLHGKYKEEARRSTSDYSLKYIKEKKVLRKISAIKQIRGNDLTLDDLRRDLALFAVTEWAHEVEPILTSYFVYRNDGMKKIVDFIHESFKEYLVAEYYLECMIEKKFYRLYVGAPSLETLQFLDGLLGIFNLNQGEAKSNEALIMFYKSFESEHNGTHLSLSSSQQMLEALKQPAAECLQKHELVTTRSANQHELWYVTDLSENNALQFPMNPSPIWLHRWIGLFVTSRISGEIDRSEIIDLIKVSGETTPSQLKDFRNLPLSRITLRHVNLNGANFEDGNLFHADLTGCDLTGANLRSARMPSAILWGASLQSANCEGISLVSADLTGCNLANAKFDGAAMTDVTLDGADFGGGFRVMGGKFVRKERSERPNFRLAVLAKAKIRSSDIGWLDLSGRTMTEADLSASRLVGVNFSGGDLSHARLKGTIFLHCKLVGEKTNLSGADLTGAIIYETSMNYCSLHKANLTGAYLDKVELDGVDLRGADLRACYLGHLRCAEIKVDSSTRTEGILLRSAAELKKLDPRFRELIKSQNRSIRYGEPSDRVRGLTMMFSDYDSLRAETLLFGKQMKTDTANDLL